MERFNDGLHIKLTAQPLLKYYDHIKTLIYVTIVLVLSFSLFSYTIEVLCRLYLKINNLHPVIIYVNKLPFIKLYKVFLSLT